MCKTRANIRNANIVLSPMTFEDCVDDMKAQTVSQLPQIQRSGITITVSDIPMYDLGDVVVAHVGDWTSLCNVFRTCKRYMANGDDLLCFEFVMHLAGENTKNSSDAQHNVLLGDPCSQLVWTMRARSEELRKTGRGQAVNSESGAAWYESAARKGILWSAMFAVQLRRDCACLSARSKEQELQILTHRLFDAIIQKEAAILRGTTTVARPASLLCAVLEETTTALHDIVNVRQLAKPQSAAEFRCVLTELGAVAFCDRVVAAERLLPDEGLNGASVGRHNALHCVQSDSKKRKVQNSSAQEYSGAVVNVNNISNCSDSGDGKGTSGDYSSPK